jgi:hypothetical protein
MARRAAWRRRERRKPRRQRRSLRARRSAERRRCRAAPPYGLRPRRRSMTASNGPATADERNAQCDRNWARRPRWTARASAREEAQAPSRSARAGPVDWETEKIPSFTPGRLCRRLALPASRRCPRLSHQDLGLRSAPLPEAFVRAAGQGSELDQLERVHFDALQTSPPRMQPSSLIVFASCRVRLPL